jgi:hypothetical protein
MSNLTKEYIYIGKFFHRGDIKLPEELEKKIGKTIDLTARESELGRTKSPIGYAMIAAWETNEKTPKVERSLHSLLDHNRTHGEWFLDPVGDLLDRISDYMSINGFEQVNLSTDTEDQEINVMRRSSEHLSEIKELRKKINLLLLGETFHIIRRHTDFSSSVTIKENGFYCNENGTLYETLNSAFSMPFKNYLIKVKNIDEEILKNDKNVLWDNRNVWSDAKDTEKKSVDFRLLEKNKEILRKVA